MEKIWIRVDNPAFQVQPPLAPCSVDPPSFGIGCPSSEWEIRKKLSKPLTDLMEGEGPRRRKQEASGWTFFLLPTLFTVPGEYLLAGALYRQPSRGC